MLCSKSLVVPVEDQIWHVNNMGVPAIAITDEENVEIIQQVMNGNYFVWVEANLRLYQGISVLLPIFPFACSISDRRFFSFATQFLQTYLFSVDRKDISKHSISERTSNCFHPFESNTFSFLFSMTRQHKLQYMDESDMALSTFQMQSKARL